MEPSATLKLKDGGPEENGRVWVSQETLVRLEAAPGSHWLLSVASGHKEAEEKLFQKRIQSRHNSVHGRLNLRKEWDIDGESVGGYYVGCEVWPSARLNKQEIQISKCLHRHLRLSTEGDALYIDPLTVCHRSSVDTTEKGSATESSKVAQATPSLAPICDVVHLCLVQCLDEDGGSDLWMDETVKKGSRLQLDVLKAAVRHQLHGRLMIVGNVLCLPLLGSTLLFTIDGLMDGDRSISSGIVDGDRIDIDMKTNPKTQNDEFLERVQTAAEGSAEGSRQEAAVESAVRAAENGLRALRGHSIERCLFSDGVQKIVHTSIVLPLTSPSVFEASGVLPPRGLILHGPPGGGKTMTAIWAAAKAQAHLFIIDGPSILSQYYGASEASLSGVFAAAKKLCPSLILLDEMDAIVPSRDGSHAVSSANDTSTRLVTTLLTQFDAIEGHRVVVVGATNRLDAIDDALRRPGRFDRELEISVPDAFLRGAILKSRLKDTHHNLSDQEIDDVASKSYGFLPADLAALCKEAGLVALRRHISGAHGEPFVTTTDVSKALVTVRPSGMREFRIDVPEVHWNDVGGLDDVKQRLKESVEWPLHRASAFERLGTAAPKGILLFGPPGCSKTLLAKAVSTESGMHFIAVVGSELLSTFVGESEKSIARLFARARQMAPCIVFIDEIDGLLIDRNDESVGTALGQRVMSQMLTELDGIRDRGHVIVIGATNKPQLIDGALLRPGRFDRLIYVPPPDEAARKAILKIQTRDMSVADDVDIHTLASMTEDYTGADLASVCREAGICALEENINADCIQMRHFLKAIEASAPSLDGCDAHQIDIYARFQRGLRLSS